MLDIILKAFAEFERRHQLSANILDLSHKHFRMLVEQYPGIFDAKSQLDLGFNICLHSDRDQVHPSVRRIFTVGQDVAISHSESLLKAS